MLENQILVLGLLKSTFDTDFVLDRKRKFGVLGLKLLDLDILRSVTNESLAKLVILFAVRTDLHGKSGTGGLRSL